MKLKKLLKRLEPSTVLHIYDAAGRDAFTGTAERAAVSGTPCDSCKILQIRIRNNVLKIRTAVPDEITARKK